MPPYPLTNFEVHGYYQNEAQLSSKNEPKFDGVFSEITYSRQRMGHLY